MSIFRKISDRFYYYMDSFKATNLNVKIDHFGLDRVNQNIIVIYRLGRRKLLNKMNLSQFEKEYFEKISHYDQHRLTKFSTLEYFLKNLFCNKICKKEKFITFIEEHVKNEQLF